MLFSWLQKSGKRVTRQCSDPHGISRVLSELKGNLKPRTFVSCVRKKGSFKDERVQPVIKSIVRSGLFVLFPPDCAKDNLSTQGAWALANGHTALAGKPVDIFENLPFDEQRRFLSDLYQGQKKLKVIK